MLVETATAVELIRKCKLTDVEQVQIEDAIAQLSNDRRCTRQQSAVILNRRAFPES